MKFVKKSWYAAAWSEDIGEALFSRKILNEPVLLYRKSDKQVAAVADLCPHRFLPLSQGKRIGDEVECAYHGLKFNDKGECTNNPNGNGKIPRACKVRAYPIVEKYKLVWIWMGDPELADEELVPDYHWLDTPDKFTEVHGTLNLNADYLLVMDNLTDLSHAAFIHEKTLEPRELAQSTFEVSENGREIWTKQWCANMEVPPLFKIVKGFESRMDHWLEMRCIPPSNMITFYGVTNHGDSRSNGWGTYNPNILTPETDTTTHYFWATARDFDLNDENMTKTFKEGAKFAFENEDKPVIEAQFKAMNGKGLMEMSPVLLVNDSGSVKARRAVEALIDSES